MRSRLPFLFSFALIGLMPFAAPPPQGDVGTLSTITPMSTPRAAHTATLLPDGRVVLIGGLTGSDRALAPAELYTPTTTTFTPTGPSHTRRQSHTATLLMDGTVLIAGGYDVRGRYLATAERYDPATGRFTPAGTLHDARANHVAVPLEDGRVLLIGGVGTNWTFLASAERYDPATDTFARTGAMSAPRESHAVVRLDDGRVFVVGGHRGRRANIDIYTSAEIYDPATGRFAPAGDMTVRRHKHDAVRLPDGRVLITGGTDERDNRGRYTSAEVFDPATGRFRRLPPMHLPRYKHAGTSIVLPDGRVLLGSGAPRAEVFDPATDTFYLVPGAARMVGQFAATALLPDGGVLITGGYGEGRGPQPTAWRYRP